MESMVLKGGGETGRPGQNSKTHAGLQNMHIIHSISSLYQFKGEFRILQQVHADESKGQQQVQGHAKSCIIDVP